MISEEEMSALNPGDVIRVISREDLRALRSSNELRGDWGVDMDNYCGQELTVQEVYRMDKMLRVYVYENSFYWLPEFCDCVVERYSDIEPVSQNELLNLLFV